MDFTIDGCSMSSRCSCCTVHVAGFAPLLPPCPLSRLLHHPTAAVAWLVSNLLVHVTIFAPLLLPRPLSCLFHHPTVVVACLHTPHLPVSHSVHVGLASNLRQPHCSGGDSCRGPAGRVDPAPPPHETGTRAQRSSRPLGSAHFVPWPVHHRGWGEVSHGRVVESCRVRWRRATGVRSSFPLNPMERTHRYKGAAGR